MPTPEQQTPKQASAKAAADLTALQAELSSNLEQEQTRALSVADAMLTKALRSLSTVQTHLEADQKRLIEMCCTAERCLQDHVSNHLDRVRELSIDVALAGERPE